MNNKKLRKFQALLMCAMTLAPYTCSAMVVYADSEGETYSYAEPDCDIGGEEGDEESSSSSDLSSSDSSTTPTAGNSWLTKIAGQKDKAEKIKDELLSWGLSGPDVAVMLAHAARESGMNEKATNPAGGVAGLWQWSGFSSGVNGNRITATGKIKPGDTSTLTLENQMELLKYELQREKSTVLDGGKSVAGSWVGFKNAKTDEERVISFNVGFEGVAMSDPQSKASDIMQYIKDIYKIWPDLEDKKGDYKGLAKASGESSSATGTVSSSDESSSDEASGDDCGWEWVEGGSFNAGVLDEAKKWIGKFIYGMDRTSLRSGDPKHPVEGGTLDCSSFVWLVLKNAGYDMPDSAFATPAMESDAKKDNKWFQEIDMKEAKAGDVVVVNTGGGAGANGHTVILQEDWDGADSIGTSKTKVTEMHGPNGTKGPTEDRTVSESLQGLIDSGGGKDSSNVAITFMRAKKDGKNQTGSGRHRVRKGSKKGSDSLTSGKIGNIDLGKLNQMGNNPYPRLQCTWGAKALAPWAGNGWGNGGQWAASARAEGYKVDRTPKAGSLVCFTDGAYGHIGFVQEVKSNGEIVILEANFGGTAAAGHPAGIRNAMMETYGRNAKSVSEIGPMHSFADSSVTFIHPKK